MFNKANLSDLIAATGLLILLKLYSNRQFYFIDGWPLLYYIKLCASSQLYLWIQTGITAQKCSMWVTIGDFLSRVTLKWDKWPWKTIGHLFYAA